MEQAIANLTASVAALTEAASRAKPTPPAQDFSPQVQAAADAVKVVADQLNAAFPAG